MTNSEFKKMREYLGLTQEQLSSVIGIDMRTVQRYEQGQNDKRKNLIPRNIEMIMLLLTGDKG